MQPCLVVHPDRREWRVILFAEEPWRTISTAIFGRKPELPHLCSSPREFEELFAELEYKAVLNYVLRRLSFKQYASSELQRVLQRHLVPAEMICRVLAKCREQGYLDDEAWLESVVRGQLSRGKGPQAITMLLGSKGVSAERVSVMLEKLDAGSCEHAQILKWLEKRYRGKDLSDPGVRHKAIGFLFRKGFALDAIQEAFSQFKSV